MKPYRTQFLESAMNTASNSLHSICGHKHDRGHSRLLDPRSPADEKDLILAPAVPGYGCVAEGRIVTICVSIHCYLPSRCLKDSSSCG